MPHSATSFDLNVVSVIVRSDKPNKGLEAVAAANPNLMHRLTGYLDDGRKVVVCQRHGKGGMDFNKLLGGKVFAVAADGFSPVFEKDADKKPTKVQKLEDGLPLFSASGFYLLSSKEYPGIDLLEGFTKLLHRGEAVAVIDDSQFAAKASFEVGSDFDLELLDSCLEELLDDSHNMVSRFDADVNKKRTRGIDRSRVDAEDAGEGYTGVSFRELAVSKKDGNPFVMATFETSKGRHTATLLREVEAVDEDSGQIRMRYFGATEAVEEFHKTVEYKALAAAVEAGETVVVGYVAGNVMRTSVSFRRKVVNVLAAKKEFPAKAVYGDGVYVLGALEQWTRGILTLMHSMHPNFPTSDYDAHHYVAAPRQAEVGMNKKEGGGWTPPAALQYDLVAALVAPAPALRKAA